MKLKFRRKQFGIISQTGAGLVNGVGAGVETMGNATASQAGQTLSGLATAYNFGDMASEALGGGIVGNVVGRAGAYFAGKAAAKAVGSGMQTLGQNMQDVQG